MRRAPMDSVARARAADAARSREGLTWKRAELESERGKTRELLAEAERPSPPRGAPAIAAPAAAAAPAAEAAASPDAARVAPAPRSPEPVEAMPPAELPPPVIAAEARIIESAPAAAAAADVADADVTPPPTQRADARRLSGARNGTFDELAFLSSVVNTPAGAMDTPPAERPDERARRDSFAQRGPDEGIVN